MTKVFINTPTGTIDADSATLPANRNFRDAWFLSGVVVEVDMIKAREIKRAQLRLDRMPKFANEDKISTPLTRKSAGGGVLTDVEKQAILTAEANAQKLRDAPAHASIAAATTPEELDAINIDTVTA